MVGHVRRYVVLLVVVALAAIAASVTTAKSTTVSASPVKIAFIYAGDPKSGTWDKAIEIGRLGLIKAMGSKVQTTAKYSVPQGPQTSQVIDSLVAAGNQMIIATSYGYNDQMLAAAKKYPKVKFVQTQQATLAPNLGTYDLGLEDGYYLGGMLLASAAKNGKLGFVGSFPIPTIISNINALELGAKQINPKATIRVIWTNSWYSPIKEKQAADSLVAGGIEAVADDVGDPSVGQALEKTKTPWFSFSIDQSKYAPDSWFSGALTNYTPYFIQLAKALIAGTWAPQAALLNMPNNGVQLAKFGKSVKSRVTSAQIAKVRAKQAALKSGRFRVFDGPIVDQSGKQRVAAGKRISPSARAGMNWYVKGVIGKLHS